MSNLSEEVIKYLKLKKRREQVRKAVKHYVERKKLEGTYQRKKYYYPDLDKAHKYKSDAIMCIKRLYGTCHLI